MHAHPRMKNERGVTIKRRATYRTGLRLRLRARPPSARGAPHLWQLVRNLQLCARAVHACVINKQMRIRGGGHVYGPSAAVAGCGQPSRSAAQGQQQPGTAQRSTACRRGVRPLSPNTRPKLLLLHCGQSQSPAWQREEGGEGARTSGGAGAQRAGGHRHFVGAKPGCSARLPSPEYGSEQLAAAAAAAARTADLLLSVATAQQQR